MKVITEEIKNEGLVALLGQEVTIFCCRYIYTGKLVGVNDTCVKLEDPRIVYDTGCFTKDKFSDVQSLGIKYYYVTTESMESFGVLNKS